MRYLGTHVSTVGGVGQGPLRAREIPVNTIQLFAKNNNQWLSKNPLLPAEIETFKRNRKECGVAIAFSHAGYLINLASPDPKNHGLSLESLAQELERAELLELDFVVLHPGAHVGSGMTLGIHKISESLNKTFDAFPKGKTQLLLETTAGQGTSVGHTFEQLAAIFDKVKDKKRIGICLDTCHVFAGGYDIRTAEGYEKMWQEFDQVLGLKKLKAIHLNDSKTDFASHVDRHDHIGQGKLGDLPFQMLMQDSRFEKTPMVLETPKHDDFVKWDRINLKKLMQWTKA
ncbi:MAG: deoxyribonuclease IV [Deltaproteobacteria bacterium]|nr:deoxyribonuclease IV [Deltaproteobacteria bacterium]